MIEITQQNFEDEVTNSPIPVVLDLWAPWCGPCRMLTPVLEKLGAEFEGRVKVAKINVDDEQALAEAFNVTSIPMIVAVKGGEVADVAVGFRGEGPIRKMFEELG